MAWFDCYMLLRVFWYFGQYFGNISRSVAPFSIALCLSQSSCTTLYDNILVYWIGAHKWIDIRQMLVIVVHNAFDIVTKPYQ